jgi:hypothetical protein
LLSKVEEEDRVVEVEVAVPRVDAGEVVVP